MAGGRLDPSRSYGLHQLLDGVVEKLPTGDSYVRTNGSGGGGTGGGAVGSGDQATAARVVLSDQDRAILNGVTPVTATSNNTITTAAISIPAGALSFAVTVLSGTNLWDFNGLTGLDPNVVVSIGDEVVRAHGVTRSFGAMSGNANGNTVLVQWQV